MQFHLANHFSKSGIAINILEIALILGVLFQRNVWELTQKPKNLGQTYNENLGPYPLMGCRNKTRCMDVSIIKMDLINS